MASQINASNSGFGGIVSTGDSSGQLQLQAAGTTAVTIDTSQNVGIGVTPSTWSAGQKAVQMQGGQLSSGSTTELYLGQNYFYNSGTYYTNTAAASYYGQSSGAHIWANAPSGTSATLATFTEQMRIDSAGLLKFNSGYGSAAVAYGCRAWVNFNGTGTIAIRASGNVSSITDNGTGDYTVNFTTSLVDANYSPVVTLYSDRTGAGVYGLYAGVNTLATGSFQIDSLAIASALAYYDSLYVDVAVFR